MIVVTNAHLRNLNNPMAMKSRRTAIIAKSAATSMFPLFPIAECCARRDMAMILTKADSPVVTPTRTAISLTIARFIPQSLSADEAQ
jgi:hypothetical protein